MEREFIHYNNMTDDQLLSALNGQRDIAIIKKSLIADLPDGWLKDKLTQLTGGNGAVWLAVLPGANNDWSAYHSLPNAGALTERGHKILGDEATIRCLMSCNPVKAASNGDKMMQSDAEVIFPRIAKIREYRL